MKIKDHIIPNIESINHSKKFKRTNRKQECNSNRSNKSQYSVSSTKSFYIPAKNMGGNLKENMAMLHGVGMINLDQTFSTIRASTENQRQYSEFSVLDSFERSGFNDFQEDKKTLLEQNLYLKKENEELKRKNNRINESFEQHLQRCENKITSKMKTVVREAKIKQLEEKNKNIEQQMKNLKQEIRLSKKQIQTLKQALHIKQNSISLENCENQAKNNSYIEQYQKNYYLLKEENKQLKLKIDHMNRQLYKDIEIVRVAKEKEIKVLRQKYLVESQKNRKISRQNIEFSLKIKKIQKQLQRKKTEWNQQGNKKQLCLTKKKTSIFLEFSSDQQK